MLLLLYVTLFGLLTWQEAVRGPLLALDPDLRTAIAGPSVRPEGTVFTHFVAKLGNIEAAVPMLGLALVFAWWRGRRWRPVVAYALAMAAIPLIVSPLKAAIGRDGPGSLTLAPGYPGLFPSGHAATATLAYGAATLLVLPYVARKAARRLLVAAAVLLNTGVGVALVYCGYHWPLDVLGSWLLCGALLTGAALAVRGFRSSSGNPG
jgi:undecaprenyl-diphosphatase